jgi:glutamate dehydrogenase (NADP+)
MVFTNILRDLEEKYAHQQEFLQAVKEVLESISNIYKTYAEFEEANIIKRLVEPDRILSFKIPWIDDNKKVHVNRGFRVQFNNALGPYKGGLRFHPSVNESILKFLGFEQIFKNALTGLPLGGGKGGSDFDPRGKSDNEIMRFCQQYMIELYRVLGENQDVPAGDIGVSSKEIGYMFGMYKKLSQEHTGVFTGKGANWGGSLIRPEATGFGGLYFIENMLLEKNDSLVGKTITISGFGNVSWGAALKATQLGAKVISLSGPDGYVHVKEGLTNEQINYMLELRKSGKDKIELFAQKFDVPFFANKKPWELPCNIAIPCATQNELNKDDAQELIKNGCELIGELSNMGCTSQAIELFHKNNVLYAPGKAANAGGVAVSGLEMSQNSMKLSWSREEVDEQLKKIMKNIHEACVTHGKEDNSVINYQKGANIAGFLKVAQAMIDQGVL